MGDIRHNKLFRMGFKAATAASKRGDLKVKDRKISRRKRRTGGLASLFGKKRTRRTIRRRRR